MAARWLMVVGLGAALGAGAGAQERREPVVGTVVGPDGAAVAGARVEAWRRLGEGTVILDLEYSHTERRIANTVTDRRGGFALQLPMGIPCELRVDDGVHARWLRPDVVPGEPLRIALAAPAMLTGRVALPGGVGTPASLRAFQGDGIRLALGRTAADGSFRCERLPAGEFTLEVEPDEACAPEWRKVTFVAGETVEVVFDVVPGVVLTGRVTDKATGKPIAGAVVGEGWTKHKGVRTDADGRYRLAGFGSEGYGREVWCSAGGYSSGQVRAKEEQTELDFALGRGNGADGVVVDAAGKGIAGLYVALVGTVHDGRDQFHDWAAGTTDAEGRFRLQGLREDLPGTLVVRGEGRASLVYHLPPADRDGVMHAGTIAMPVARVLRGVVVGDDGKPLARVKVGLWGTNGDREKLAALVQGNGLQGWDLLRMYVALRDLRTDDQGAFAFGDLPPGTYDLMCYGERNERLHSEKGIVVTADADPAPLRVVR